MLYYETFCTAGWCSVFKTETCNGWLKCLCFRLVDLLVSHAILCHPDLHIYLTVFNLSEPCVLYIGRAYRYPPNVPFYIFFSTNISTEYFKHAAYSPFFSSKCRLFHNATFFWFLCYSHLTYRVC